MAALGLGDGAGGDACEARERALREASRRADRPQRGAEPCGGRRGGKCRLAVLDPVAEDAALDPGRAALGLGHAQAAVLEDDDALGHALDLAPHRLRVRRRRERPVGDRAQLKEEGAAQREEPLRGLRSPALAHRLEAVEEDEVVEPRRARLPDRLDQGARLREVAPRPRVHHVEARIQGLELLGRAGERHPGGEVVPGAAPYQGGEERLERRRVLGLPDDVVPPEQPSEGGVELGEPGRGRRRAGNPCFQVGRGHGRRSPFSVALLTEVGHIMPDCL